MKGTVKAGAQCESLDSNCPRIELIGVTEVYEGMGDWTLSVPPWDV